MITVVVPVYNVEKYLKKCVDSIIKQSYYNIEIILIDDGSTDNSRFICDEYVSVDKRIVTIHQENEGLSKARNSGIDIAKGKYIAFIDSDDYIHPNMLSDMYDLMKKYSADIVECSYAKVLEGKPHKWEQESNNSNKIQFFTNEQAIRNLLDYKTMKVMAWNKLYRKNLFDDLRYPVGKIHEDEFLTPKIVDKAKLVVHTNRKYYAYVQRKNSIMKQIGIKNYFDILEAFEERYQLFVKRNQNETLKSIIDYHLFVLIGKYFNYTIKEDIRKCVEKEYTYFLNIKYKYLFKNIINSKEISLIRKIKVVVLYFRTAIMSE